MLELISEVIILMVIIWVCSFSYPQYKENKRSGHALFTFGRVSRKKNPKLFRVCQTVSLTAIIVMAVFQSILVINLIVGLIVNQAG